MRKSVGDAGFWDVWLDGVLQKAVVMADDETGEVERYAVDEDGQPLLTRLNEWATETVYGKVEIRPSKNSPEPKPAKVEGLVAPNWSDSGDVPVGEVTEWTYTPLPTMVRTWLGGEIVGFRFKDWVEGQTTTTKPSDPNAKPSLPALTRVGGNKRGPGWCDE